MMMRTSLDASPDEAEVNSQRAVDSRAVDAQEHAVWNAGPARVFGSAVKTRLKPKIQLGQITDDITMATPSPSNITTNNTAWLP